MEVDLNKHFSSGFQLRGFYTHSKSLDDGTAWNNSVEVGFVMFPLNPKLDWGLFDTGV